MNTEDGKKNVLIVEDDPDNLEFVIEFLEQDFSLLVAENGDHAVALSREHHLSAVLMDLKLDLWSPPTTGFDLTARLRELPEMSQVPIIATSARSMDHERKRAIDSGCNDLISKPIDFDVLIDRLHKICD